MVKKIVYFSLLDYGGDSGADGDDGSRSTDSEKSESQKHIHALRATLVEDTT